MAKRIGILTAGGDAPGLNAAIRGFGKSAIGNYGWELIGFKDGLRGLVENRSVVLDAKALSGILTVGGTILGTSRDKVHRMNVDGQVRDMIPTAVQTYNDNQLDALVMLGGGGTAKNARRLMEAGLNVIHLPKTIDNDIVQTDSSFGFVCSSSRFKLSQFSRYSCFFVIWSVLCGFNSLYQEYLSWLCSPCD